jgi:prophage antirepressor-like protein
MSALEVFAYAGRQVRTVLVDGEPWFVANDVCAALGIVSVGNVVARLDPDERSSIRLADGTSGNPNRAIINEAGLYAVILRSDKPEAKAFKRWVTHEVLPQIRRTGQFRQSAIEHQAPRSYADALRELAASVERREVLEAKAIENAPKVAAYDQLMDSEGFYPMDAVAKLGGIGRTTLFNRLRAAGVIQATSRLPYQRYAHWFKITTSSWTDLDGVAHPTSTPRVLPEALVKVLAKAGVEIVPGAIASVGAGPIG